LPQKTAESAEKGNDFEKRMGWRVKMIRFVRVVWVGREKITQIKSD
jgi:hypothetical protein